MIPKQEQHIGRKQQAKSYKALFYTSSIKHSLQWAFLLITLFCLTPNSNAQNENLRFEHIGIEEGLSNENVTAILQDSKGYIWFGTWDGLNKYDGYTFTKYKFDPFDSNSISQNFIYTIFEDKSWCDLGFII